MREREARPVTWAELKVELNDAATLLAAMWLGADTETKAAVQALAASGNSVLAQLVTGHVGPPPSD